MTLEYRVDAKVLTVIHALDQGFQIGTVRQRSILMIKEAFARWVGPVHAVGGGVWDEETFKGVGGWIGYDLVTHGWPRETRC